MMIESMAGKSASLHGLCLDATQFTFSEDTPAVDYYGQQLVKGLLHICTILLVMPVILQSHSWFQLLWQ